jgi:hypothetical protein
MKRPSNVVHFPDLRLQDSDLRRALTELRDRAHLAAVENATIAQRLGEILERGATDAS